MRPSRRSARRTRSSRGSTPRCDKALADQGTRDALFKAATEPVGGDTERLATLARANCEKYARIVREVNIKMGS